jgi:hypothetical protein
MSAWKPPSDTLLALAAEARAEGGNWVAAGERAGRSARTVRRWPLMYPERWREAMRVAARRAVDDAAAESVFVLRQLVRDKNKKLSLKAAWYLLHQRLEQNRIELQAAALLPPPPPSEAQLIADLMDAHPPEQLLRFAANVLNSPASKRLLTGETPKLDPTSDTRAPDTEASCAARDR